MLDTIAERAKARIADLVISGAQLLITKIVPLLLTGFLGKKIVLNGVESELVTTPGIDPSDLNSLIWNVFFFTFVVAILSAFVFRVIAMSRRVSVPFDEAPGLRRLFSWIGLAAFLVIVAATVATSTSVYFSLVDGNSGVPGGAAPTPVLTFAMLLFSVTAVIFVLAFSLACFWAMPPALRVLAQPGWIRWLPRLLGRFDMPRGPRHG